MSFKQTLNGIFGKNAVKKALIWLLIVAVAAVIIITQFAFPTRMEYRYTNLYRYTDSSRFELMISGVYDKLTGGGNDNKNSVLLSDTRFDMTKPENYLRAEMVFEFVNIGMYKTTDIQFKVNSIGKYADRFVFKEANFTDVNRFSSGKVALYLVINTEGMTDEQLNEAINSLSLSYTFERPELFASGGDIELPQIALPLEHIIEG